MWWSAEQNNTQISKSGAAAFLAHFWPVLGLGWDRIRVRVRVRVRVGVRARGWVGSTPVPLSDQEVLSARKREQPTAPTIRAANLLGELAPRDKLKQALLKTYCFYR